MGTWKRPIWELILSVSGRVKTLYEAGGLLNMAVFTLPDIVTAPQGPIPDVCRHDIEPIGRINRNIRSIGVVSSRTEWNGLSARVRCKDGHAGRIQHCMALIQKLVNFEIKALWWNDPIETVRWRTCSLNNFSGQLWFPPFTLHRIVNTYNFAVAHCCC